MKIPESLERMMFGFIESQVLFVCNDLKLFDYLAAQGSADLLQISNFIGSPPAAIERLLISATSINLLKKENNQFKVNDEFLPFLIKDSNLYYGGRFTHYWKTSYKIFEHLKTAIQENKPQWDKINPDIILSKNLGDVYDPIYKDSGSTEEFLNTMWDSGYADSIELCKQFSFSGYHKLVDLGGGSGSFTIAALQENEQLYGEIIDYLEVKVYAEAKFQEYKLQDRAVFREGDMFKDDLPAADIYVIGYVLSDWPESLCLFLIEKVYNSLPSGGMIIILEKFFNDDKTGSYVTSMLNLTMLLEMYGTHRTTSEYIIWLKNNKFDNFKILYSSGEKHMIVGIK